ncbi:MAG: hypothetical protein KZQ76_08955 [Candidatus Thiodiazotropha sp. (ex Epidulcina cf. delphinae)]|nr:hypothetical protein [Candidatus Thiodiazotropha sp. (ex Epidulcina cf. delphinae)]
MKREKIVGCCTALGFCGLFVTFLPGVSLAEADTRLSDSLRKSLQAQGWQEYRVADGNFIYRQSAPQSGPVNQPDPTLEQQRGQLGEALEAHGWQVEWEPDGSLVLNPQAPESIPATEEGAVAIPDLPGFEYWRIERDEDGSMRFYPLGSPTEERSPRP